MIGMILAAGSGSRLRPVTDNIPQALAPLGDGTTILERTLGNFAEVGITEVVIVAGYRKEAIDDRRSEFETTYGLSIDVVFNDKAEVWNNAYSLWCARSYFDSGFLLANGDTLHPVSVEQTLLAQEPHDLRLAIDNVKVLADEEMKVQTDGSGCLSRITKLMEPTSAVGEYIGVTLVGPNFGAALSDALEATFTRDPNLYYEDAYQELVNRGHQVALTPIGTVDWIEVDNLEDLERAKDIACRS